MDRDTFAVDVVSNTKKVLETNFNFHNNYNNIFVFTVSALRSHLRECGRGAQCPLCPKIVTQKRNLAKHMEKHKRDGLWQHATLNIVKDEIQI